MKQRPVRICFVGNAESPHVSRWARHFQSRGFEVLVLTYFTPRAELTKGVPIKAVRGPSRVASGARVTSTSIPLRLPGLRRLVTLGRLWSGGFYGALNDFAPDIVHGHYVSDYGFLASAANRHPFVVSAWGSDLLHDPVGAPLVRWMVGRTLRGSDLVTYDASVLADAAVGLGARKDRLLRVVLGVSADFLEMAQAERFAPARRDPLIVSFRSLGRPLFNIDTAIRAMPRVLERVPMARLEIGNDGALRPQLEMLVTQLGLGGAVEFTGYTSDRRELARRLGRAAVYLSIPSSDGTSVTLLEAMAAGAYPIVSDIPANREWVDGTGGAIVPVRQADELADDIIRSLTDPAARESAAARNLRVVVQEGLWEANMARMESAYLTLAAARSDVNRR